MEFRKRETWKPSEVFFLTSNYSEMTYVEIAKRLNKTANSVRSKISRMRLRKNMTADPIVGLEKTTEEKGRKKMENFRIAAKIGDTVEVTGRRDRKKFILQGKVIFKNKYFITIKSKNYKESFLLAYFYTKKNSLKIIKRGRFKNWKY